MTKVPVGLGTQAGLIATLTAFVLGIIAFIDGDRTEETIGALVTGAVILATVINGRMQQAREQIRKEPSVVSSSGSGRVEITPKP